MLSRVLLALLASLCLACGGEPEFDAHVRIAANGVSEFEGHAWSPPRPDVEPVATEFWIALQSRSMQRRRPAYPGAPERESFSACRLLVTIDPEVRMEFAQALLSNSDMFRWQDTRLACPDPAVPTLDFTSSTDLGISQFGRDVASTLIVGAALSEGGPSWSLLEEPRDEHAVWAQQIAWERASHLVRERRPHGGRLNLWIHVPPAMTWREFAPHLQRALALEPAWVEFEP